MRGTAYDTDRFPLRVGTEERLHDQSISLMPCNIHFLLSAFLYIAKRSSEWVQGSKGEGAKQMGPQRRQAWLTGEGNWEKVDSQGERMVKGCCHKRAIRLMEQTVSGDEGETNSDDWKALPRRFRCPLVKSSTQNGPLAERPPFSVISGGAFKKASLCVKVIHPMESKAK